MKASQLTVLLSHTIRARRPTLVVGAPGVGKSEILVTAAAEAEADVIMSHPAVADPTDAKGLPWAVEGAKEATFLPFGELARAMAATKLTVWFLDDLGQAAPATQASFMQLLLARQVNGHKIPDCVTFVAATNRRTDRAGVTGILEPVKSRFTTIVELTADLDDWCTWAFANKIPAELIAFMRFRPELLSAFEPKADMEQSPTPRTWTNLARLQELGMPLAIENEAFAGAVGPGASAEYLTFRRTWAEMPSIDQIFIKPYDVKIPAQPATLYAVATALGLRITTANFGKAAVYIKRLADSDRGEFAALTLRDALRRDDKLAATKEFVNLACGPLGALIGGAK